MVAFEPWAAEVHQQVVQEGWLLRTPEAEHGRVQAGRIADRSTDKPIRPTWQTSCGPSLGRLTTTRTTNGPRKALRAETAPVEKSQKPLKAKELYTGGHGVEPATPFGAPHFQCVRVASEGETLQRLTPTPSLVCTRVCTSEAENANAGTRTLTRPRGLATSEGIHQGDPLAGLAAAIADLTPADRERLAAMLAGRRGNGMMAKGR